MSNIVKFKEDAKNGLIRGVNIAGDSVRPTLGAKGRNVIIQKVQGGSLITNDGVTVLRNLDPKGNEEKMGVNLVREGAAKSESMAGDGTTTVSILIQSMVNLGNKYLISGSSPLDLKRGMDKACDKLLSLIKRDSIVIESDSPKLKQVSTISANNDAKLGKLIADLFKKAGKNVVIDIQESNTIETTIEVVEGAEYDRGFVSQWFANNAEMDTAILENPYILVTDHKILSTRQLLPILDEIKSKCGNAPLLLVSDEIDDEVMSTLVLNVSQKILNLCCIKAPGIGDERIDNLRDIATITGATYINSGMKMELGDSVTLDMLGRCDKVVTTKDTTKLIAGYGDSEEINKTIDGLKERIRKEKDDYLKSKLERRLSKIIGGVSVIYIGAPTETELEEKKMRIDDAIQATRAALTDGIVPGGGVLLAKYSNELSKMKSSNPDEKFGIKIVADSIKEPFYQIISNAGESGEVVLKTIIEMPEGSGFDVKDMEYCNLMDKGIVDPAKVQIAAIQNSVSIASMILTTDVLITEIEDDE